MAERRAPPSEPPPAAERLRAQVRRLRAGQLPRRDFVRWCLLATAERLDLTAPRGSAAPAWSRAAVERLLREPLDAEELNAWLATLWCGLHGSGPGPVWSAGTLAAYAGKGLRFLASLGEVPLTEADSADVADFLGQEVSAGAFFVARAAVLSLLALPGLERAPAIDRTEPGLRRQRERQPAPLLLPADFEAFLAGSNPAASEALERWRRHTRRAAAVLGHMGLRIGEVWRLEVSDIDPEGDGCILVRRSKRGTTRRVPLRYFPPPWQDILLQALAQRRAQLVTLPEESRRLLIGPDGAAIPRAADIAALVVPPLRQLSGQAVTFHALRRGAANLLLAQGLDVRSIAVLLGHASVWSTLWYLPLVTETARPAADALSGRPSLAVHDLALLAGVDDSTAWRWLRRGAQDQPVQPPSGLASWAQPMGCGGRPGRPPAGRHSLEEACTVLAKLAGLGWPAGPS